MYIFNPENDLALANFSPHFTAPASALKMRRDLAMLPLWYALHEVLIIAEGDLNSKLLSELKEVLPINSSLISYAQIGDYPHCKVKPWGWNPSIRKELIQLGINEQLLPSLKDIELLRNYSSRQNAVKLLEELKLFNSKFCGESFCYTDINQLLSYLSRTKGDQVLKMPYSGSGKGIVWLKGAITDKQTDWCRRVIKMQGGVVVEPALNKVQDFAMEFEMTNSDIQFLGYSLFRSAPSGAYLGNVLLSDEEIENKLSTYIERSQLLELKDILKAKLSNCFPSYRGYFGVDMMVCKTDEAFYQIQPCVEVNMRMNMGIVAHRINERFVYPKSTGLFSINFYKKEGEAQSNSLTMQAEHPLVIKDGKIKRGYLSLTPVDEHTQYTATIAIKEKSRKE
jgi:hypothetical protein